MELRGFVSSEDGDELVAKLEKLPQQILSMLPFKPPILPSMVDSLLAVIRKDRTATIYLNEAQSVILIRIKGSCEKGELITKNRVLDMGKMRFPGVDIPPDAAIIYVFSVGWRKGFFYDLEPLYGEKAEPRGYDLEDVLGSLYSYLSFQERFKIDNKTWQTFFAQKWFPFVYLDDQLIRDMISHARAGWQIDELLPKVSANVGRLLETSPLIERKDLVFAEHIEMLKTSVERYLAGDHISCASILYPRIEGLLRSFQRTSGCTSYPTAKTLSKTAVEHHQTARISASLLLPSKFNEYLDNVYFAHFIPGSAPDVGRHSVAHGEARTDDFSLKATTVAFLIIYQLSLFFSDEKKK
ncbi:MAG: hypothetical protein C4520_06030 [Candidatus Abyssobacteria bacterium SURF_5]|uniref:DUF4209 domain-containing protein n=1 Tax=Abyssobacteria bacterium (strain SURF_5) TaxID=2093360 RepID=A0A3A4NX11_ABYX5|nr:MAG: hypothetical protein C4520_06030 [Candidatus Abyssubacteria bacterium SURF_5]